MKSARRNCGSLTYNVIPFGVSKLELWIQRGPANDGISKAGTAPTLLLPALIPESERFISALCTCSKLVSSRWRCQDARQVTHEQSEGKSRLILFVVFEIDDIFYRQVSRSRLRVISW